MFNTRLTIRPEVRDRMLAEAERTNDWNAGYRLIGISEEDIARADGFELQPDYRLTVPFVIEHLDFSKK